MNEKAPIHWYKTAVQKETLAFLTKRSNAKGAIQTLGYLAIVTMSGVLSAWSYGRIPLFISILLTLGHGVLWSFMLNGFHELSHGTVFKTKEENRFFYLLFSFLSWNNHVFFKASHRRHHAFTLHHGQDREVILPIKVSAWEFWTRGIVNPLGLLETLWENFRFALGIS